MKDEKNTDPTGELFLGVDTSVLPSAAKKTLTASAPVDGIEIRPSEATGIELRETE